jgi:DNA polymerase (family 10)/putative hydrolase
MKKWKNYEEYLMSGEWHIHTNYTDGKNSVRQYCKRAAKLGLPLVAFTEHVRRDLTYDFDNFIKEVESAREEYSDLIILTGCEAKVLEGGRLDVSQNVTEKCDIVLMAFHSFLNSKRKYTTALKKALCNPRVDIWAHPSLSPNSTRRSQSNLTLSDEEFIAAMDLAKKNDVLLEINRKYKVPPQRLVKTAEKRGVKFVRGSDVHNLRELR